MAGIWDVYITVKDVARKEVAVRAVRTEGADVRTYSLSSAIIDTPAQKLAILDLIWSKYQEALAVEATHAGVIDTMEATAKANLEAREV